MNGTKEIRVVALVAMLLAPLAGAIAADLEPGKRTAGANQRSPRRRTMTTIAHSLGVRVYERIAGAQCVAAVR